MRGLSRLRPVLDLLLPPACFACGAHLGQDAPQRRLCVQCSAGLRSIPHPRCRRCSAPIPTGGRELPCLECAAWSSTLARAQSAVILEGPASRLVHALKYGGWDAAGRIMAERIVGSLRIPHGVLVPVPTTARRLRQRGYNQAEVIARNLALIKQVECIDAMVRSASGTTQVALQRNERVANVHQAFSVRGDARSRVRGAHVVLVDDVLTTGATACAAAVSLADAGAARVDVVTFARTLPDEARPPSQ